MLKKTDLHDYQLRAAEQIVNNPYTGEILDMGLGKTVTTLTAFDELKYDYLNIDKALVIAPKRVASKVWADEVRNWEHLTHLKISVVQGTPKQRIKALEAEADIYTISRDLVVWLCAHYGGFKLPYDMLIVDESSSFKNPSSKRFKALRKTLSGFKRRVILTGTFAPNGLLDLWSQVFILDKGQRLEKHITHYREIYFRPTLSEGHVVYSYGLKRGSEEKIQSKIKDICVSMSKEDYLNLPDKIENKILIPLPEDLKQKYKEFEREKVIELYEELEDPTVIPAVNAAALSNKLLQFSNGAIYDEDKNIHEIHDLKLEACKDVIEEANGKPVLIAYAYQHDRDRLLNYLESYNPKTLDNDNRIDEWNRGGIKVLIMHPQSGGHGLNLQKGGSIIIWVSPTWSLELQRQLDARLHRQGQKNTVIIHKILCEGTHDLAVVRKVHKKGQTEDGLKASIKALFNKYVKK